MPDSDTPRDSDIDAAPDDGSSGVTDRHQELASGERTVGPEPPVRPRRRLRPLALVALAVVPAVVVGLLVWLFAPHGGGNDPRRNADVASVLNAFGAQQGTTSTRFEGQLPPGVPKDIPRYPGSKLVSSLQQISGKDAAYLIVYDTSDSRDTVARYFERKLSTDPWQLEGGQTDVNGTLHQFSNISDNNVSGLVLVAQSKGDKVTTIVESVQVVSGAAAAKKESFTPGQGKPLPQGFPASVPEYPGSTAVVSGYRKQSGGNTYIVSMVTKDRPSKVIDYYKAQFTGMGWTAQTTDAGGASSATPSTSD